LSTLAGVSIGAVFVGPLSVCVAVFCCPVLPVLPDRWCRHARMWLAPQVLLRGLHVIRCTLLQAVQRQLQQMSCAWHNCSWRFPHISCLPSSVCCFLQICRQGRNISEHYLTGASSAAQQ
jgi:hypothetical protein